ncbi:MAG: hypothetical protein U0931_14165 [Vulcanimicrobiota bacterium]
MSSLQPAPIQGLSEHLRGVLEVCQRALEAPWDEATRQRFLQEMAGHLQGDQQRIQAFLGRLEKADREQDLSPVDPIIFEGMGRFQEAVSILLEFTGTFEAALLQEVEDCCREGDELLLEAEQELANLRQAEPAE